MAGTVAAACAIVASSASARATSAESRLPETGGRFAGAVPEDVPAWPVCAISSGPAGFTPWIGLGIGASRCQLAARHCRIAGAVRKYPAPHRGEFVECDTPGRDRFAIVPRVRLQDRRQNILINTGE